MVAIPSLIVVQSGLGVANLGELIALAKSRRGSPSAGHPGVGSYVHLASETFHREAGIDVKLVPYRGAGPVMTDLIPAEVALFAPTGTPQAVLDRLGQALSDALDKPDMRARLEHLGTTIPAETDRHGPARTFVRAEIARWSTLAAEARQP